MFNAASLLTFGLIISYVNGSWNSAEMQMFDLVEELRTSFYDFLRVSETASVAEIKRAYRKLSITMHPDRNPDDPQADAKFRRLVGVYEVLKDEALRESYDHVLKNGLPTWKSSMFYYRKLRKMSNIELCGIFALLCTVVHYAVLWGSRFEKSLTLESQLRTSLKAHKARDWKKEAIESEIAQKLSNIPRPQWHDLFPFAILKGCYYFAVFMIDLGKYMKYLCQVELQQWMEDRREKSELKKQRVERLDKKRPAITKEDVADIYCEEKLVSSGCQPERDEADESGNEEHITQRSKWTDTDLSKLVEAVSRYPGGVRNRWEIIAKFVGRPVADVINKAKQLGERKAQPHYSQESISEAYSCFETNVNDVCGESSSEGFSDNEEDKRSKKIVDKQSALQHESSNLTISYDKVDEATTTPALTELNQSDEDDQPYMSRKKLKQQRLEASKAAAASNKAVVARNGWTQVEQKQLEMAIRSIPKHLPDRWEQIACCVPTKSKASVINRIRELSSIKKPSQPSID